MYPERMLHGDVPIVDFQTLLQPGNAVLLAAALKYLDRASPSRGPSGRYIERQSWSPWSCS